MRQAYGGALIALLLVVCLGSAYENLSPFQVQFPADGVYAILDINSSQAVWFDRNDTFPSGKTTYSAVVDMNNSTAGKIVGEVWFFIDKLPTAGTIAIPGNAGSFIDDSTMVGAVVGGELHKFTAFGLWYAFIILDHGAVSVVAKNAAERDRMLEILFFERRDYSSSSFYLHKERCYN